MLSPTRILLEPEPHSGAWNMAADEALLESAQSAAEGTVRLYRWREPTLSLGYFQRPDELPAGTLAGLPAVRRLTGGGAILHDQEWTYSLVLPREHPFAQRPRELYGPVHRAAIALLKNYGAETYLRGEPDESVNGLFLCFGRGDEQDVLCRGYKILGSAQRRRRGATLQHGSLLLRRSAHALEFPGLLDLQPLVTLDEQFPERLTQAIAGALGTEAIPGELTDAELQSARRLEGDKYRRLDWR